MTKTVVHQTGKHYDCVGKMYELGEDHMTTHCMVCSNFNKCKDIGYGVETKSINIPEEPSKDKEYHMKW